jgi:hypothetical protein
VNGVYSNHRGDEKSVKKLIRKLEGKKPPEGLSVNGRIILKLLLEILNENMWTRFIYRG